MKKMLLIILMFATACIVTSAQSIDTIKRPKVDSGFKKHNNSDVILLRTPQFKYLGNKNHYDIYEASPDKMLVIKPDSIIHFNMPIKGSMNIIIAPINKPKHK